ncbi:aminotransferase class I/II-fold pyridoxal phosphate-dependent enzyme [Desulfobacula sp.]|uniref:threonine aldolase family protein n=1 Tax=Desulfobacula sp. TaxID=2593537 RepID=UPI0026305E89|nr:aminotransferase class I/II-fold pyridoxal phosphate-dependent enzyme [Desulfobacula sp.]
MFSFQNDYSEGAHPNVLEALQKNNMTQEVGYGLDRHTQAAIAMIQERVGSPEADVHLISGGTQTNLIAISAFLRPHEACIAAVTSHIATHETGAIEATGHKLLTVDSNDGKLSPDLIEPVLKDHHFEHMVKPRLVYISNPTELGTVYARNELQTLHEYCRSRHLLLYADGARLGAALTIRDADVTLKDMYTLTDAFFIGGTKIGALLGEALVLRNADLKAEYRYLIKQRGALLAKGRVLGIQFEALFKDNLYFELAQHANAMAQQMVDDLKTTGCRFWIDSPTNQIFPVMKNSVIEALSHEFLFYIWAKADEAHSAVRLVTSWATSQNSVQGFIHAYTQAV